MPGPRSIPRTQSPASVGRFAPVVYTDSPIHDLSDDTLVVTPSASEAISDSGTVTVAVTPSQSEATADSGAVTLVATPSEAEANADSGTVTCVVTPSQAEAISDSGTVTVAVTPFTGTTLIDCGFEAQSLADDAEGAGYRAETVNVPAIETSTVYEGAASLRATLANSGVYWLQDGALGDGRAHSLDMEYRVRVRFYLTGNPTATALLRIFSTTDRTTAVVSVRVNASRVVQVLNRVSTVVGSSSAISANAWHEIELVYKVVTGGGTNSPVSLYVDGPLAFGPTNADLGAVAPKRTSAEIGTAAPGVTFYWDSVRETGMFGEAIADSGTCTLSVTPSEAEADADSGTVTAVVTPSASEAISDSGTVTLAVTPSASEAGADSGTSSQTVSPSGSEAIADAGTASLSVTPSETEADADSGTAVVVVAPTADEAITDSGTVTLSASPSGSDVTTDGGSDTLAVTPSSSEATADAGSAVIAISPSHSEAIAEADTVIGGVAPSEVEAGADAGTVTAQVAPSGTDVLADQGTVTFAVATSQSEALADTGTEEIGFGPQEGTAVVTLSFTGEFTLSALEPTPPPRTVLDHPPVAPISRIRGQSRVRVRSSYSVTAVQTSTSPVRVRTRYQRTTGGRSLYVSRLAAKTRWSVSATSSGSSSAGLRSVTAIHRKAEGPRAEEEMVLLGIL